MVKNLESLVVKLAVDRSSEFPLTTRNLHMLHLTVELRRLADQHDNDEASRESTHIVSGLSLPTDPQRLATRTTDDPNNSKPSGL